MVDPQKKTLSLVPFGVSFVGRKRKNLYRMAVGVFKVERLDAGRVFIPIRQALRAGGGVAYMVPAQLGVGLIHVAYDDRKMLEPSVVAVRIQRDGAPFRGQELPEFNVLFSQLQSRDPCAHAEDAVERFSLWP